MKSDYIEWAKTRSQARFNLASSGVIHYSISELGATLEDIELSGPSWYGYEPLQQALAKKCNVATDCVVAAIGTSMANYLAMGSIARRGDEVLIEEPSYEPLISIARYLGCEIKRFRRRFENGFKIDLDEVRRQVTARTRLIVITNLHNPTGVLTGSEALRELGAIARHTGAKVLVDEVYLEMLHVEARDDGHSDEGETVPHAFSLGTEFVVTSSLTKAYGLSGLRCGWILAEPELARAMWRLNDIFGNIPSHPAERLSVLALQRLEQISDRARFLLKVNRGLLDVFLDSRDDLEVVRPAFGTIVFPRLRSGNVAALCVLLREKYETSVVPGRFFEMPNHFRIGIGCPTETLAGGLERLGAALDDLARGESHV